MRYESRLKTPRSLEEKLELRELVIRDGEKLKLKERKIPNSKPDFKINYKIDYKSICPLCRRMRKREGEGYWCSHCKYWVRESNGITNTD